MARSGEKSNFAMACSLLSQYIKEKRDVPDLGLGMPVRPQETAKGKSQGILSPKTMSLLPGAEIAGGEGKKRENAMELFPQSAGLGSDGETQKFPELRELEKEQLTIFYDGKVMVFDNIPAEKAKDLMQFACKSTTNMQSFGYAPPAPAVESKMASNPVKTENINQKPTEVTVSNIRIAPRASLQRFLEKRKHRISAAAPYQVSDISKQEESKTWLGLASQPSTPSISLNSDSNW